MSNASNRLGSVGLISVVAALLACADGGANEGQRAPGDAPGGVQLGIGDIAVAPTDAFVVFERGAQLAVGWTDTGAVERLPVFAPTRLAFSKTRSVVYVGATEPVEQIVAVDVENQSALWKTAVEGTTTRALRLMATSDDRYVVAADTSEGVIRVLDAESGEVRATTRFGAGIVDVQILAGDDRALVVLEHDWDGDRVSTPVQVLSLDGSGVVEISVPNCSDRVALDKEGRHAFLAPTRCVEPSSARAKDPISLIDLEPGNEAFVRNMPGFGPVAVSPEGSIAVGFLDRDTLDRGLFDDEALIPAEDTARYHLMLIDTATLGYEFVEVGDRLPRFAVTPTGSVLLVDSSWMAKVPARLFDVHARAWQFIDGEPLSLDNFVITSDSSHAYVIETHFSDGLYDLDIAGGTSEEIPLSFVPRNINISPSDRTLFLRKSDREICVFSLETRQCETTLVSDLVVRNP